MVVGVGNVPIEVKGLSKPLTLQCDDVEGQCQLMALLYKLSKRFCVDFRKVNDATIKDAHPLPRIDDTLESLH